MQIKFQVDGVGEVVRKIGMYDMEKRRDAGKIVRKTTTRVGKEARSLVPESPANRKKKTGSPGDLKKSISAKYYHGDLISVTIPRYPKGAHRYIIEHGTKNRVNKKGQNRGRIEAKPFMAPAKRSQIPYFNAEMKKLWEIDETII